MSKTVLIQYTNSFSANIFNTDKACRIQGFYMPGYSAGLLMSNFSANG
ncbi:hypothetical protein [Cytophaga hutchinsonii]|nr:hypothetical protein [Cytophaga hutchinsonii]